MADALGFLSKMGIKVSATWDTAYAAVDLAIPFLSETLTAAYERIQKESLLGYGGREVSEQGNSVIQGTTEHELDYNNYDPLYKMILGEESPGNTFNVVNEFSEFAWLEFDKQTSRHRFGASVAHKLTISGAKGELVKAKVEWFSKTFDNAATAFPGISPATATRVRFQDLVFRIADQVNALAGGDAVAIESFEIMFDRSMKLDDYVNSQTPISPVEGDFRACEFSFKLPRYNLDTLIDWKEADTPLQADFVFTRGGETLTIQFTEVRIVDGFNSEIGGSAPLVVEGKCEAYRGGAHGFMYAGNEMKIIVT